MADRTLEGYVQLPADDTAAQWAEALVELRDVSALDAPSHVIASVRLPRVRLAPGLRLPFALQAPSSSAATVLNLRVQVQASATRQSAAATPSMTGGPTYLTTEAHAVAPTGNVQGLVIAVTKVAG